MLGLEPCEISDLAAPTCSPLYQSFVPSSILVGLPKIAVFAGPTCEPARQARLGGRSPRARPRRSDAWNRLGGPALVPAIQPSSNRGTSYQRIVIGRGHCCG